MAASIRYKVTVYVTYKESVLDPQGQAVQGAISRMGYQGIDSVRIGKYFEIEAQAEPGQPIEQTVDAICDRLLANPNMETYRYEIEPEPSVETEAEAAGQAATDKQSAAAEGNAAAGQQSAGSAA